MGIIMLWPVFAALTGIVFAEPASTGSTSAALAASPRKGPDFAQPTGAGNSSAPSRAVEVMSRTPVYFEPNQGQADPTVRFLARGLGHQLFLSGKDAVMVLHTRRPESGSQRNRRFAEHTAQAIRMTLDNAHTPDKAEGLIPRESYSNYFLGNDPSLWRSHVPHYEKVSFSNVYDGIDMVYYANQKQLEFDFVVRPGGDPAAIRLSYQGVDKTHVDANGDLILTAGDLRIRQQQPAIYQERNGKRQRIDGAYQILADGKVGFRLAGYDHTRAIVIDPIMQFATFLGGNGSDSATAMAVDINGFAYIVGQTASTNFPVANAFQSSLASASKFDGFMTKLNSATGALVYSTYIGGPRNDILYAVALDNVSGEIYAGGSSEGGFPTAGAGAVTNYQGTGAIGDTDGVLIRLSASGGQLRYSTYIGSQFEDVVNSIVLFQGKVWVAGVLGQGYQSTVGISPVRNNPGFAAGFVARFNASTPTVESFTYIGGNFITDSTRYDGVQAMSLDASGNIYAVGSVSTSGLQIGSSTVYRGLKDAFVMKLNSALSPIYFHYVGGSADDEAFAVAVTSGGEVYVAGNMVSTDSNANVTLGGLANNKSDAFVLKMNTAGAITNFAAIGGVDNDQGLGIAIDSFGTAYVSGTTKSSDFPTTFGAPQRALGGGFDVFLIRVSPNQKRSSSSSYNGFNLLFSTYFGYTPDEQGWAVTIDASGNIFLCGIVGAPTANPASVFPDGVSARAYGGGTYDGFFAKLAASRLNVASKAYWILDTNGFYNYTADITMANLAGDTISNLATGYRAVPTGTSFSCTGCSTGLALVKSNVAAGSASAKAKFRLTYTSLPSGDLAQKPAAARTGERAAFNLPPGTPPTPPEVGTTTDSPVVPPDIPTPGRPVSCTPGFDSSTVQVSRDGGTFSIPVTGLPDGCGWFLKDTGSFINPITDNSAQSPDSPLQFFVPATTLTSPRSATITIRAFDEAILTVNQDGLCSFTVTPGTVSNFASGGGPITFTVTTTAGCAWNTTGIPSFMTATTATSGTGSGSVSFNIAANGTSTRSSNITIAGQTIPILQLGSGGAPTGLRFVPLPPCRVMETRSLYNFEGRTGSFGPPSINASETRTLNLPASNVCAIPATAKAYVVNVTLIPSTTVNFVTVWPAGDTRPNVWTIRSTDGQIVANSAIVKAGTNGGISVFTSDRTDLLIDISGYYTDSTAVTGLVYYPLTPCRVIDTRILYRSPAGAFGPPSMNRGQTRAFRFPSTPYCSVPTAAAYSVTVTVAPPAPLAFLTAWPDGSSQPNVSSINSFVGRTLANNVIIPASADGSIDVFTFDATDFLIDINGFYAPDDGTNRGLFYFPVTQCRASDSTVSGGAFADDTARTINIPAAAGCSGIPSNAQGYAINVTALPNNNPMPFITAYPTGQPRPNASILNAFQGQVVSNAAIIPAGTNGAIDIYAYRRTDVVVEVSGYFGR